MFTFQIGINVHKFTYTHARHKNKIVNFFFVKFHFGSTKSRHWEKLLLIFSFQIILLATSCVCLCVRVSCRLWWITIWRSNLDADRHLTYSHGYSCCSNAMRQYDGTLSIFILQFHFICFFFHSMEIPIDLTCALCVQRFSHHSNSCCSFSSSAIFNCLQHTFQCVKLW